MITQLLHINNNALAQQRFNQLNGLGDAANVSSKVAVAAGTTAAVVAAPAAASALVAIGVSAQAIPVIGQIAGAIALIAGFLAGIFGKRKAMKQQTKAINQQTLELQVMDAELDKQLVQSTQAMANIKNELILAGYGNIALEQPQELSGAKADLERAEKNFKAWEQTINRKVEILQQQEATLQAWYDKLTGASVRNNIVLGVGISFTAIAAIILMNTSWKKEKK